MFITPMVPFEPISQVAPAQSQKVQKSDSGAMFIDVFKQAINNVKETENEVAKAQYQLATGQLDDIHTLLTATTKAGAATDLLVTLRSKALDAYNEIMRINL